MFGIFRRSAGPDIDEQASAEDTKQTLALKSEIRERREVLKNLDAVADYLGPSFDANYHSKNLREQIESKFAERMAKFE